MYKILIALTFLSSLSVVAAESTPQGSTLESSSQSKSIFFARYDLVYRKYGSNLSKKEMAYVDQECELITARLNENHLDSFVLDDLIVGEDVSIHRKLPEERFYSVNVDNAGGYLGCKYYLSTSKLGYMVTTENYEFLNVSNCEKAIDSTKQWIKENGKSNYVGLTSRFVKIQRKDRLRRKLPRGTKACIVSTNSIQQNF